MVNWDPGTRSAISDLEVEDREVTDTLYYIDYPLEDGSGVVTVATVRPETMLADTAVAVNPDDERYKHLVGKHATLPLVGRRLPIIADDYVKPEFGTGALKITPGPRPQRLRDRPPPQPRRDQRDRRGRAHDRGRRPLRRPHASRRPAEAVVEALEQEGLIRKQRALHAHGAVLASLRRAHRAADLAPVVHAHARAGASPRWRSCATGQVRFHPERWGRVYLDWLENIRPWCISRQLWWGHRLPVWYCDACEETYVVAPAARALRRLRRRAAPRPGRARHLVLVGAVAVRDARLAARDTRSCAPSTRRTCSSRPATSSSCGSPAW